MAKFEISTLQIIIGCIKPKEYVPSGNDEDWENGKAWKTNTGLFRNFTYWLYEA